MNILKWLENWAIEKTKPSDPHHILGVDPIGAHPRRPDTRDYPFTPLEVAEAAAPFQWQVGNGPDTALMNLMTIKNQGDSGSCGGQAFSYYGQCLRSVYANDARERSAKYLYSQAFVPTGGSDDRTLANLAKQQGFGLEADCPSYPSYGGSPTEQFMERPQDITPHARIGAGSDKIALAYAFPLVDLESVAQAATACSGIILGIHGENNGTWLSTEPRVTTAGDWAHWLYGAQPQIYNGKKGIWVCNSWGKNVGINGWQFINEDHFTEGAVWGAMVLIYNPTPEKPPQHVFNTDIKLGDDGAEVLALQQYLAYDGEFNVTPNGHYGAITSQAVLSFQLKYALASSATLEELGGHIVGPATRAKLNSLIS